MKLTIKEEYEQWLINYEYLLTSAQRAWRLGRQDLIEELNARILTTQVQIAMCARQLKKEGYAHARNAVSSPVSANVKVGKDSAMNFNSIGGNWTE